MSNLVPVKRICFGSVEFMFMRTDLDIMIRERERLKKKYQENKERVGWLGNTIRAIAELVYFKRVPRKKIEPVPDVAYVPWEPRSKKGKPAKRIPNENQVKLF